MRIEVRTGPIRGRSVCTVSCCRWILLAVFLLLPFAQPGVFLCFLCMGPICRVCHKQVLNEAFRRRSDSLPNVFGFEIELSTQDVVSDRRHVLARRPNSTKRCVSAQQQKRQHANGPQVAFVIVVSPNDLWSDRVRCPDSFREFFTRHKVLADTEINHFELRLPFGGKQKVLELQIAVQDTLGVQIPDRTQHLLHKSGTFAFRVVVVGLFIETIKQFPSETKLLYQIDLRVTLVHFLQPNNVRVV